MAVAISWSKLQKGFYYMLNSPNLYSNKKPKPQMKFSTKFERDPARDFQMMAPLKKHSSQAQTVPSLVFSHRVNLDTSKTV